MQKKDRGPNGNSRRMSRGYRPTEAVAGQLKAFEKTCLVCSILWALFYLGSIAATAVVVFWISQISFVLAAITYMGALLLIARQQRGLELMVHDGSHGAWYRDDLRLLDHPLNRNCVNFFAAFPSMASVIAYWFSHRVHHGQFGSDIDPCRRRFNSMGLGHVDLSTRWAITKAVLRWLPSYNIAYYREIGSSPTLILTWASWHFVILVLPAAAVFGFTTAVLLWVVFWLVPMLVVLPVLRSIAEAEEHDYQIGNTEFETTFTNDGLIHQVLLHPWNDAYHQIHHMYPLISQRHHHTVHHILMEHDAAYRSSRFRKSILQQP